MNSKTAVLQVNDLTVQFDQEERLVKAVDHVDLELVHGEILALVGESGSGKTTLGRAIVGLARPNSGSVIIDGDKVDYRRAGDLRLLWRKVQMIFQDPYSTFDPLRTIVESVLLPLHKFGIFQNDTLAREHVERVLKSVGLNYNELESKYPHELSGGQRQRAAIARALVVSPRVLIADEPVSMLDVSLRAGILDILKDLNEKNGVTVVFVTHDLAVAQYISDRIAVMYKGKIVELGSSTEVVREPFHPYTRLLLKSVPRLKAKQEWQFRTDSGTRAVDLTTFTGCNFYPRCPIGVDDCTRGEPRLQEVKPGHWAACYTPLLAFAES
jgi:peptide/nickel transport system ATP-binding protein